MPSNAVPNSPTSPLIPRMPFILSINPPNKSPIPPTALLMFWNAVERLLIIVCVVDSPKIAVNPSLMANPSTSGMALTAFFSSGMKFPKTNVLTVSFKASNDGVKSSPRAIFPSTFCAAAFMDANEPVNVEDASFAVVPVMSKFS